MEPTAANAWLIFKAVVFVVCLMPLTRAVWRGWRKSRQEAAIRRALDEPHALEVRKKRRPAVTVMPREFTGLYLTSQTVGMPPIGMVAVRPGTNVPDLSWQAAQGAATVPDEPKPEAKV